MRNSEELKEIVREKYDKIANRDKRENETSCCGVGDCYTVDYAIFSEDYSQLDGYNEDADLGLGCGIPTKFAQIKTGDTVLDLGCGTGNDCFIASQIVGKSGKIIGIDMTKKMIDKAYKNSYKRGLNNIVFKLGDIESMPISDNSIDVVISNCVMNLVPNKEKSFAETFRVIKQGGHFSISDIVTKGELPEGFRNNAEMYAGCVSGAIEYETYLSIIKKSGFKNLKIQKEKRIKIPENILTQYLNKREVAEYQKGDFGIFSITIYAEKPNCISDVSGCC